MSVSFKDIQFNPPRTSPDYPNSDNINIEQAVDIHDHLYVNVGGGEGYLNLEQVQELNRRLADWIIQQDNKCSKKALWVDTADEMTRPPLPGW